MQFRQASPEINRAYPLIHAFLRRLRQPTPQDLEAWFAGVAASDITALQTFADGLYQDRDALAQALV